MASLFISHSSADSEAAASFCSHLRAHGFEAVFLDFDVDLGLPAGKQWEEELYAQLRRSDAVVFLASPASVASSWCAIEISLARSIGRPIFPVVLSEGPRLPLLADVQWIDLARDGERAMERLFVALELAGLDPADSFAWNPRRAPYPGLQAFAPEDAAVFFGREDEVARVLDLLNPTLERGVWTFCCSAWTVWQRQVLIGQRRRSATHCAYARAVDRAPAPGTGDPPD